MPTLSSSRPFSNKEARIRCPICLKSLFFRNGTCRRAHPGQNIAVMVQRYRCKVPYCPRVTFSVLRHPFLPIVHCCRAFDSRRGYQSYERGEPKGLAPFSYSSPLIEEFSFVDQVTD